MEGVFYTMTEVELRCSGQNLRKLPQPTELGSDTGQIIKYMDLSYNKISALDGIESYSSLETLILDCNRIGDDVEFPCCQSLTTISLNKNQIADLDHLLLNLKRMAPKLRFLSLLGNCACPHQLMGLNYDDSDYHRYRCYVIYCLPTLKFLDSTPVTRGEREEAALRGKFFQVVKPITLKTQTKSMRQDRKDLIPLPPAKLNLALHKGIYGACRYRYTGKNSEGNRFIRNHDL
ncbi:leucine-rich melanocyte differentiation-associated protein-like [Daphnia pulex]|uniref:leucine-rich melanocyte differentiation-associated protein-like n=1 Tax=Daphnia pulex TaxID=6669 RepID=UPI001EE00076|nr:leucine-rich melanocyte differentiation-associated protein-like [Daphnia pulex]